VSEQKPVRWCSLFIDLDRFLNGSEHEHLFLFVADAANVAIGAAIGIGGFAFGIGMVSFAEAQGERSKERGGGLSDSMSTQLTGMLMEDVEVSSVEDLGSLTSQLEEALKKSGGAKEDEFEMTPEEIKRLEEEADDGW